MVNTIRVQSIRSLDGNGITRQVKRAKDKLAKPKAQLKGGLTGAAVAFVVFTAMVSAVHAISAILCALNALFIAECISGFDNIKKVIKDYKSYKALKSTKEYQAILNRAKQIRNNKK